jgi:hypothetical protein
MTTPEIALSEQIRKIPQATRSMVQAAIQTVKEVAPKAEEITYRMERPLTGSRMMWKIVRYAVDGENVVGVGTFTNHATLFFYRGREIDEGSGLLQGSGKDSRYITLCTPSDAEKPAVKKLLRMAFKLAVPSRAL